MERGCDCCGETYEAKTVRSRYCSDRCKRRYHRGARPSADGEKAKPKKGRGKKGTKPAADTPADEPDRSGVGSTTAAVLLELQEAKRMHTPLGQAALVLAHRLDASHMDTGAGVASLAKQLQSTLAAATADAEVDADEVDELRRRREEKVRASSG